MELKAGIKGEATVAVTESNTAASMGSGLLAVFATPSMIALMEQAAFTCVAPALEEGCGTVGTLMNVKHLAASPVGAHIRAEAELTQVDGRRLVFHVAAYDDAGLIGEGEHERFTIQNEKFLAKANAKLAK